MHKKINLHEKLELGYSILLYRAFNTVPLQCIRVVGVDTLAQFVLLAQLPQIMKQHNSPYSCPLCTIVGALEL
jgi:hypothetical protein